MGTPETQVVAAAGTVGEVASRLGAWGHRVLPWGLHVYTFAVTDKYSLGFLFKPLFFWTVKYPSIIFWQSCRKQTRRLHGVRRTVEH